MKTKTLAVAASLLLSVGLFHCAVLAGALDPTFGSGGAVYRSNLDFFGLSPSIAGMMVQPDGKIILTGYIRQGLDFPSGMVLRFNSDGTADSTFGDNGFKWWGLDCQLAVKSMATQSDGKILVVGTGTITNNLHVFRANADGTPDATFGSGGMVTKTIAGTTTAYSVLVQSSGKIVIGGFNRAATNQPNQLVLLRVNPNGTVDNSFGPNGNGTVIGPEGVATAMVQQADGKLLTTATNDPEGFSGGPDTNMKVVRFSADGLLDSSFGTSGSATFDCGNNESGNVLTLQPDGKIVVAGYTRYPIYIPNETGGDWAIVRYTSDGAPDTGFGNGGKAILNLKYRGQERLSSITIQPDGKIVVGSAAVSFGGGVIGRYYADGTLAGITDPSTLHDPTRFSPRHITAVAVLPSGKILAAGDDFELGRIMGLARYNDVSSVNNATIKYDFDGDGVGEIGVYRAGATSGADSFLFGYYSDPVEITSYFAQRYGVGQDILVPGDYDGDRRTDFAVFRPSDGNWYSTTQPNGDLNAHFITVHWGQAGDIPAPGDFDGDGIVDRAVFRPSTGGWYILNSTGSVTSAQFGLAGDKPVAADYDNDGRADLAVVRDQGGALVWYILLSGTNSVAAIGFGGTGDRVMTTDRDGDGQAEIAVFRPSTGTWYFLANLTTFSGQSWGANGDVPAPADYDGDGRTDLAVFRPSTRAFYIIYSDDQATEALPFGLSTDLPIAAAYVR
jgi:uncharacterized delta-60 repeat protein